MSKMKKLAGIFGAVLICMTAAVPAASEEPYEGYLYDWWGDPIPSQMGYVTDRQVTGNDLGVESFKEPNDMCISKSGDMYILDTNFAAASGGKGRIVKTSPDLTTVSAVYDRLDLSGMSDFLAAQKKRLDSGEITQTDYSRISNEVFGAPSGLYVDEDDILYVADTENDRILRGNQEKAADGTPIYKITHIYIRPTPDVYDSTYSFKPNKVLVDKAKNIYVNIKSVSEGAIMFAEEGAFSGFFGANRVQATAEVIADMFWREVLTEEQLTARGRNVAAEFTNFDIDEKGAIYTVTEVKSVETDVLKKLNPAGQNIFEAVGYSDYTFGDFEQPYYLGTQYTSSIVDVDVSDTGIINLMDYSTGRIFQYDEECTLLFAFGGGGVEEHRNTNQKGLVQMPTAIESQGNYIYVLDGRKNNITVYRQTEFGALVHEAMDMFNDGRYAESMTVWQEVLRRDNSYWFAYVGMGNAYLQLKEYDKAMDYFYMNSRGGYNRAFKYFRLNFVRDNFNIIAGVIILILAVYYGLKFYFKHKKKKALAAKKLKGGTA